MPKKITKEILIEELTEFVEKNGRIPASYEFGHSSSLIRLFGSYNAFILEQGFTPNKSGIYQLSKEELSQKLRTFVETNNYVPTAHAFGHSTQVRKHFGTHYDFIKANGYKWPPIRRDGPSLIVKRFGRLIVVSKSDETAKTTSWNCRCDCGNVIRHIPYKNLVNGITNSCSCCHEKDKKAVIDDA